MTIIMVWYSVSINAFLYPNSDFSWKEMEKILSNGYWTLFGELNLDRDTRKHRNKLYMLVDILSDKVLRS